MGIVGPRRKATDIARNQSSLPYWRINSGQSAATYTFKKKNCVDSTEARTSNMFVARLCSTLAFRKSMKGDRVYTRLRTNTYKTLPYVVIVVT